MIYKHRRLNIPWGDDKTISLQRGDRSLFTHNVTGSEGESGEILPYMVGTGRAGGGGGGGGGVLRYSPGWEYFLY